MTSTESQKTSDRPWPLNPWCLRASWVMALVACLLFLAAPLITLARGEYSPGLWLVAPFMAICYGGILAIVYAMAYFAYDKPMGKMWQSEQMKPVTKSLPVIYSGMANIALIVFPAFMLFFSIAVITLPVFVSKN